MNINPTACGNAVLLGLAPERALSHDPILPVDGSLGSRAEIRFDIGCSPRLDAGQIWVQVVATAADTTPNPAPEA